METITLGWLAAAVTSTVSYALLATAGAGGHGRHRAHCRLRGLAVVRLPRRPQPGTLANPAGLTDHQLEILRLVAIGLSNAEIAHGLWSRPGPWTSMSPPS